MLHKKLGMCTFEKSLLFCFFSFLFRLCCEFSFLFHWEYLIFLFSFFFLQLDREKMRKKVSKNVGPTMNLKSLNCYGRSRKNLKNVDGVHSHNKFLLLKIYFCIFYFFKLEKYVFETLFSFEGKKMIYFYQ